MNHFDPLTSAEIVDDDCEDCQAPMVQGFSADVVIADPDQLELPDMPTPLSADRILGVLDVSWVPDDDYYPEEPALDILDQVLEHHKDPNYTMRYIADALTDARHALKELRALRARTNEQIKVWVDQEDKLSRMARIAGVTPDEGGGDEDQ